MAGGRPCQIHLAEGVEVPSVWLVTSQDDETGFPPGASFYACWDCLVGLVLARVRDLGQAAQTEGDAAEQAGDEARVAEELGDATFPVEAETEAEHETVAEEAEAADVDR